MFADKVKLPLGPTTPSHSWSPLVHTDGCARNHPLQHDEMYHISRPLKSDFLFVFNQIRSLSCTLFYYNDAVFKKDYVNSRDLPYCFMSRNAKSNKTRENSTWASYI